MRTLQRAVITIVMLCCVFALPGGAAAQSSEGAEVHDLAGCEETPIGETICFEGSLVLNVTETPSGMVSTTLISDVHQVLADGACVGSTIDERRVIHEFVTLESLQQSHTIRMVTSEIDCGELTLLCEEFVMVHYANGQLVLDRFELVCTEP